MHRMTLLASLLALIAAPLALAQDEPSGDDTEHVIVRQHPPLVTAETAQAIQAGIKYLATQQRADGSWGAGGGRSTYPMAMTGLAGMAMLSCGQTPTRGRYAKHVRKAVEWVLKHQNARGLYLAAQESRSMYGHGFATLFMGTAYGNTDDRRLQKKIHKSLQGAVKLIIQSQSTDGGWYYSPDSRTDEGSVTVTQMQGLRAARNAGVNVPEKVILKAALYLKKCQNADGGIAYSLRSKGASRPALAAAAVSCMYAAGAYDDPCALKALAYCKAQFGDNPYSGGWFYYTNFYWAQAVFQTGDKQWKKFYPRMRKVLLARRQGGSFGGPGGSTGPVYMTSLSLMILALPYKNCPIFQR